MERMFNNYTLEEVLDGFKKVNEIVVRLKKEKMSLEEENKELKEWKENLIRADKKKTEHIDELEQENKKLKEANEMLKEQIKTDMKEIERWRAENKRLKEDVDFYYKSAKQFREQIEKWEKDFVEGRIVEKD